MLSRPLSGYAKAFGDAEEIAGFGRCKHKHSTAAAYRRPLGGSDEEKLVRLLASIAATLAAFSIQVEPGSIECPDEALIVYLSILESATTQDTCSGVLVLDSTITCPTLCHLQPAYTGTPLTIRKDSNAVMFQQMLSTFPSIAKRNLPTNPLEMRSTHQVRTISYAEAHEGIDFTRYPCGLLAFSQVAFTRDTTCCVLFVERYRGQLDGYGQFLLLRKVSGKWCEVSSAIRWIS